MHGSWCGAMGFILGHVWLRQTACQILEFLLEVAGDRVMFQEYR